MRDATMTKAEWLEKRRGFIGGSDAAAAIGKSPYRSPYQVYIDKIGAGVDETNEAMERGLELEPLVIRLYERAMGRKILAGPWIVSKEIPFMAATPDAIDDGINSAVQCKTAITWVRHKFGAAGTMEVPIDYYIQAQHEMAVMGAKRNQLVVLFADTDTFRAMQHMLRSEMDLDKVAEFVESQNEQPQSLTEFAIFPIERDDATIELLIQGEEHFWRENVEKRMPPADLLAPEKKSDVIEANAEQRKLLLAMKAAADLKKIAGKDYDEAKALVAIEIGDNSGIFDPDIGKVTNMAGKEKSGVSMADVNDELREAHPDEYEIAEQESRVIVDKSMLAAKLKALYPDEYEAAVETHTTQSRTARSVRPYWKKVKAAKE